MMERAVGAEQLLYGSDRPVVGAGRVGCRGELDWHATGHATDRALVLATTTSTV